MQAALEVAEKITNVPLLLYEATVNVYKSPKQTTRRPGKKELTPPKPQPRKRRLTMVEEDFEYNSKGSFEVRKSLAWKSKMRIVVADHSKSRLLNLPKEIREMIWTQVVREDDDGRIKIVWSDHTDANDPHREAQGARIRHHRRYSSMLNLLCSCRFVYTETIKLVYSTPTFIFDEYDLFIGWCGINLPSRRDQIRHLELKFNRHSSGMENGINAPLTYTTIQHLHARSLLPVYSPEPKSWGKHTTMRYKPFGTAFRAIVDLLCTMNGLKSLRVEIDHGALADVPYATPTLDHLSRVVDREACGTVTGMNSLMKENFLVGGDFWESKPTGRWERPEWPFTIVRQSSEGD